MADLLLLDGAVEFKAAAEGKPPRISVMAYGGGVMTVAGYGPVVVDLAGLQIPPVVPLLADHNAALDSVVGSGVATVAAGSLLVEGTVAPGQSGDRVVALNAAGVPLQASVGVLPTDLLNVRAGDKVKANGREHTAPARGLTVVRAGALREVSVTPLGADPSTSVSVRAKGMSTDAAVQTQTPSGDPIRAERERIKNLRAVTGDGNPEILARAIDEGWDVGRLKAELFDATRNATELGALRASRPNGATFIRSAGPAALDAPPHLQLAASAMIMGGHGQAVAKHLPNGERLANGLPRPSGWPELCAAALRLDNRDVPTDRNELLRAAFSTTGLPNALGLGVQKIALETFLEQSQSWMSISRIVNATDFRQGKAVRLSATSKLEKVGPTGEIKHGDLSEDAFSYQIATYAKMFGITRQDLINDDTSILSDLPRVLGNESSRTVSDTVFAAIIANSGSWFGSGNGNLLTSSALSATTLGTAVKTLRTRKDRDNRIIGFVPAVLLVPAALENTARALLYSTMMQRDQTADQQPMGNPLANLNLALAVEPRLDADAATTWYVFAQQMHGAILAAFLAGQVGVTVEVAPQESDVLGTGWRAYMDFGVSLGEYRAAVKATA